MATYRIAVGTLDGKEITEHFGQSKGFRIIEIDQETDEEKPLADIEVVHSDGCGQGHNEDMLRTKIQALLDWNVIAILVKQIGPGSERMVTKNGIQVLVAEGDVETAMVRIKKFFKRHHFQTQD
ncbi:NifB/NifX family molybdenum-iron cluster-binding protein [Butyrivibrio sp. YAB3001]|uniref:NifB/NifX family molybdenum-iron cluster-binding protein n=1 Tax=Butyrivibrio sp. YAB3001 TaxID=1520812 RepID=UPI0008F64E4D|nr:NifB/NifX family molybdenum-iron cluster-binding protein [Butyrivibrio sp. YAB3001]SFB85331.1 Predicted Fe-Mo cluster-binding protein, NifX family [Butyrivibrio sp. YAB3001]